MDKARGEKPEGRGERGEMSRCRRDERHLTTRRNGSILATSG